MLANSGSRTDRQFWEQFLERAKACGAIDRNRAVPKAHNYINYPAGRPGLKYSFQRKRDCTRVNLHFWFKDDPARALSLYNSFVTRKEEIQSAVGGRLEWEENSTGGNNIALEMPYGGLDDTRSNWETVHEGMLDAMERFRCVLDPIIQKLPRS